MATKETSKGFKASNRTAKAEGLEGTRSVARPRLHVSHGTKVASQQDSRLRAPSPSPVLAGKTASAPPKASVPPRPKRPAKALVTPSTQAGQLALSIAAAALEKKASNVEIIDLGGKADYADYLVLMTGGSDRHVRALADTIEESLRKQRIRPLSVEGMTGSSWILLDFGAVVAHVFQENVRALYDIEGLWMDAARVPVPPEH